MDLSNIIAINGKPGLFKLISKGKTNFIVESILDGKKLPAFSHDGVSTLDNIAIFTSGDDATLKDIFKSMYELEKGGKTEDFKNDADKIRAYFEKVLPTYDKERVYISNIKKVITWYNLLIENNLLDFSEEENIPKETETEAGTEEAQAGQS